MSNTTRFAVALGLAGAVLVYAPPALAQDSMFAPNGMRQTYAPLPAGDCYYNIAPDCRGLVAVVVPGGYGPYAAYNAIPGTYMPTTVWVSRGLTGGDWTAIHGAND